MFSNIFIITKNNFLSFVAFVCFIFFKLVCSYKCIQFLNFISLGLKIEYEVPNFALTN